MFIARGTTRKKIQKLQKQSRILAEWVIIKVHMGQLSKGAGRIRFLEFAVWEKVADMVSKILPGDSWPQWQTTVRKQRLVS